MLSAPVRGVLVDLDDTLYPRAEFLDAAWRAVAAHGATRGLDPDALLGALRAETAAGGGRDGPIERAVRRIGAPGRHVRPLRSAFRAVELSELTPYPGAARALAALRARIPVGLIGDGDAAGLRRRLAALGLTGAFDVVVPADGAGRSRAKPPAAFRRALTGLGLPAPDVVMIGDHPDEDVAGALAAGLRAVRVTTGEHATRPDHPGTWFRAPGFAAAVRLLFPHPTLEPGDPRACRREAELAGPGTALADLAALVVP